MGETFFGKWRNRIRSAWDVLTGRAWASYSEPSKWEWIGTDDEEWERRSR